MYRFWVFGIIMALSPITVSTTAAADQSAAVDKAKAKALYKEGKALIKKKQYLEAAGQFAQAYQADPTFAKSLYREAYCYRKAKEYDKAIGKYKDYIVKVPDNPDGHFGLAETFRKAKRKTEAINSYKSYLVNEKRTKEAKWVKKAQEIILQLGGNLNGITLGLPSAALAKKTGTATAKKQPAKKKKVVYMAALSEEELMQMGQEKMTEAKYKKAAEAYSTAFSKNPSLLAALFKKGVALQKAGNFLNARTTFEAYDKKFPNDPDTIYQMAETERLMGNTQRAGSLFQRYLKLEGRPNRAQQVNRARLMTAELLGLDIGQGQASKAAAAVKQTADSPLLGQALLAQNFLDQAQLAADRGDRSMAMHLMSLAVSYAPTEPAVHEKRGKVLVSMHNSLDAEVAFQTAVTYLNTDKDRARMKKMISKVRREGHLDGSSNRSISEEDAKAARVIFEQSEKMWSEGDALGAIKGFRQVIQYDPNWEQAYIRLGTCLLQQDENSEALNTYRKANLITPQNEAVIWGMAMAADNLGDKPLAKDYFRLYLKLPNDHSNADRSRVAEKKIRESLY